MKRLLTILFASIISTISIGQIHAQENDFHILPEVKDTTEINKAIEIIWKTPGSVMDNYKAQANSDLTFAEKMAGGIMNRNTLLEYVAYLIRFLSQIGLVIGAAMIIYAGYQYAMNIFGGKESDGNSAIKYAIIGVLVISFSYAIIRFFTAMFLGT